MKKSHNNRIKTDAGSCAVPSSAMLLAGAAYAERSGDCVAGIAALTSSSGSAPRLAKSGAIMVIVSCRGEKRKIEIVNEYNLTPLAHISLLAGQEKQGCCGKITRRYYVFSAEHKTTKQEEVFYVGYDCAEQFLELTNQDKLPLFNPLRGHGDDGNSSVSTETTKIKMAPLNRELYNAIHILCAAWDRPPKYGLLRSLEFIRKSPHIPTKSFAVVNFNNILAKDARKRSLLQILNDLRVSNPDLREFSFPCMSKVLEEEGEKSHL